MRLGTQIVKFSRLDGLENTSYRRRIDEVTVVKNERSTCRVPIVIEVIDPVGVEEGRPADDPVHLVALLDKEFGEI